MTFFSELFSYFSITIEHLVLKITLDSTG